MVGEQIEITKISDFDLKAVENWSQGWKGM